MSVAEPTEAEASDLADSLCGIVTDYPTDNPRTTLQECADRLAANPGGPGRDGLVVILNATSWYAASGRIGASALLEDMAAALRAALATLDPDACDGGHPHAESADWDPESAVTVGTRLLTEEGRGLYDPDEHDLPLEAWTCPKAVAALAAEAVETLAEGLRTMSGEGVTDGLDERYVGPDGRVDVRLLADTVYERRRNHEASAASGLWAARRIVSDVADTPRDRLGVLLSLGLCVSVWHEGLVAPYLPAMEAAIATVDLAAGEAPCPHGDTPHPWSATPHRERLAAVTALFGPEEPSPEALALWSCPRNLTDLAEQCLTDFRNWRTMRMYD
ncbi:hypothetical protein [Actinomadura harenae]|uniref:Uncharacterized protein n=1 Tax=Actinomadura harenae TaxID=2483351 RepID=A0A3M2M9E1_9ACTN|nr:hypothetical protein [Actinomadura harenae]RMI45503.1 hypothetical protein EBO15_09875 [Actinomadura harenae]